MTSATDTRNFYANPESMTKGGSHTDALLSLPSKISELARCVQQLVIYDVVAKDFYGFEIPVERQDEIHLRSVESLLNRILELDHASLTEPRTPSHRVVGRCHHFTKLAVAALRAHGIPARVRCGFGGYFNPPRFEDHWLCEYWDAVKQRWVLADVQFDQVWIDKLKIRHDVLDVPRREFLVAGDAWRQCRTGERDANDFGIEFAKLRGLWFIAGSLIREVASLNKVEMLPWDAWGAQPKPNAQLDKDELRFFDQLAALTSDPDAAFEELESAYQHDERLHVPQQVFNSLTREMESVNIAVRSPPLPGRSIGARV